MMLRLLLAGVMVFVIRMPPAAAQADTCPAIVQQALAAVQKHCASTGRNQACYGNITISAEPQADITALQFGTPGDIVEVASIRSLTLSPMAEAAGQWGIALMKLQANLPGTLPGQNVTVLMFGDVAVMTAQSLPTLDAVVSAQNTINVRAGPSVGDPVVTTLAAGTGVAANGRSPAGDWLWVRLPDGDSGWVFANLLRVDGNTRALAVVDAAAPVFNPMQAFYFRSGVGDAPCAEVPDSGILIQTPQRAGEIRFTINDAQITLRSTVYLQAAAGEALYIYLVTGEVDVTAFDQTQTAFAGTVVTVPLDENLRASGPPDQPEPYAEDGIHALPLVMALLPDAVLPAAPMTTDESEVAIEARNDCTLTADRAVNLRSGPGTSYPRRGELAADTSIQASGRAVGAGGYTWWQLDDGSWVRADVVGAAGDCAGLPLVVDIPATATSAPVTPSGGGSRGGFNFGLNGIPTGCTLSEARVGQTILISFGTGLWPTPEEADAQLATAATSIFVNGVSLPVRRYRNYCDLCDPKGYGFITEASWTPTAPGTYTAAGLDMYGTISCPITITN